jgi:anti-sigma factor RsiW
MKTTSSHLTFEQICDLALGDATPDGAASLNAHLRACPQCEVEFARTRQLVGAMKTDATEDAPAYAIAAILRAFDEHQAKSHRAAAVEEESRVSTAQKILAKLSFDSARLAPSFGFRSAGAPGARQLLFMTGDGSLDLRIAPRDQKWVVSGQLLGLLSAGGRAELRGAAATTETRLGAESEFEFSPVPDGIYQLHLHAEGVEVEIPDLEIGN